MPGIVDANVERWLLAGVPPRTGEFAAVEEEATRQGIPCIGPYEGQVLWMLASLAGARNLLEIGTATGYSALWLARAVAGSGGKLTTVERDPARAAVARANLARCGYGEYTTVVEGDGFDFLAGGTSAFDFIFLDMVSALEQLPQVDRLVALCLQRLAPGGVLVSDNALHAGQVADSPVPAGAQRYARYNQLVGDHPELDTVLLSVRDGMAVSRRRPSTGRGY
ncbi:MAG TPA: O-methyltransferase [Chloroflexota bacterium]